MVSKLDKAQFYIYKYFVTGFFVLSFLYIGYLGVLDIIAGVVSIFSSVAVVWGLITAYLVKLSFGMTIDDFLEE